MGAWGAGSFENDTALDFLASIAEARDGVGTDANPGRVGLVIGPIAVVDAASTDPDAMPDGEDDDDEAGYLDASLACDAIVAAEVIAAIHGKPHPELEPDGGDDREASGAVVGAWACGPARKNADLMSGQLRELARSAMIKIRDGGELQELWHDVDGDEPGSPWVEAMNDLIERLR
jgi:hypothetical protein